MDFDDYAELRRRAEKRLTVISAWPLILFQAVAYVLMMIRSPLDGGVPLLSLLAAGVLTAGTVVVYRWRTAANRKARRAAIDDALEDAVETGWPLEDPTTRDLRMLASLLDDDMETRAGMGRVIAWSGAAAVMMWIFTFVVAGTFMYSNPAGPYQLVYVMLFLAWLAVHWSFSFVHRRERLASDERVDTTLRRASGRWTAKPKRAVQAVWWDETDEDEYDKPKRLSLDDLTVGEDGELDDGRKRTFGTRESEYDA